MVKTYAVQSGGCRFESLWGFGFILKSAHYEVDYSGKKTFLAGLQCTLTSSCAKRGTLWDFLNIHSVAKYQKIDGGTLWSNTKNRKNEKFEQSNSAEKRGEKSHSAEKCKRGTLWDFLNIHSVAKYQKIDGGTLWSNTKNRKNEKFEQSNSAEKRGKSRIVPKNVKGGPFGIF